jgi:hypothetical protein
MKFWANRSPDRFKFLRHKRITTTQIYADTSLRGMSENYLRAFAVKQ